MVARLVRIREDNAAVPLSFLRQDVPATRTAHSARHARPVEAPPEARPTPLSIRSAECRRWSADLARHDVTAVVLYGIGGIGKSTLAAQIASRVSRLAPERVVTTLRGEISPASLVAEPPDTDLVVLDNFGDNLTGPADARTVRDPALAALLAGWTGKLLITSDTGFALPEARPGAFVFCHLGPLTRSGAGELALSLPALRQLDEPQRELAWRLTAGHPRGTEYLDALMSLGVPFEDLADRLAVAVRAATGMAPDRTEPTELSEGNAEVLAAAAGTQLLGELVSRLSAGALDLLVRASVFRTPVDPGVLAARPANVAECAAAGLLAAGPGRQLSVHRWTAGDLHRQMTGRGEAVQLAQAHREAAAFWQARIGMLGLGPRAQLETSHHLRQAAALTAGPPSEPGAGQPSGRARSRLRRLGLASAAGATVAFLAVEAASGLSPSHLASADRSDTPAAPAAVDQASAARDQAATWVASEVSGSAIIGCDPAMCSVLVRSGTPAADLLVLSSGAGDPLGSAVIVATPAVRAMFGSRLATVYAPQTLASFGSGATRIDIRAIAPDGAGAYRAALAADLRARRAAGLQLLAGPRVTAAAAARIQLAGGSVDARLLIIMAALAHTQPVQITAFTDDGPGSSSGTPLRSLQLTAPKPAAQAIITFVRAQRPPYLPAHANLTPGASGEWTVTLQFPAPSPLGLLSAPS
jgi:hypothetical protein